MYTGIDTAARITAEQAAKIKAQGLSFVGRYLVPETYGKALTAAEADALRGAGLAILLCWEIGAYDMKRGAVKGAEHGARARQLAEGMGVPAGTVIYFAADYDVPSGELLQCEQYLKAAQAALGKYKAGAYGGERLISFLADRGLLIALWQCVAWTNIFNEKAGVIQYAWQGASDAKDVAAKLGFAVDLDSCEDMRAAGLWMPEGSGDATIPQSAAQTAPFTQGGQGTPWYAETMAWARKEGVCDGTRPEDYATRAEVCQMIRNYNRRFEAGDEKRDSGMLSE